MSPSLEGLRVIVTVPPHTWTGGLDFNYAVEMVEQLRADGAMVFELDTSGFIVRNAAYVHEAVQSMKTFRADVAMSLPNAGYAILCRTPGQRHVFTDVLQIPTIMLWDHGLFQFPKLCLEPLPETPEQSAVDALQRLRAALEHPLYYHYAPDSEHISILERLKVVRLNQVKLFVQPAYPNCVRYGYRAAQRDIFRTRLSFAGNVYPEAAEHLPFRRDSVLRDIEERAISKKLKHFQKPFWDVLMAEIDALDRAERNRLRLEPNSTFFWRFVHDEVEVVGNTRVRLAVLSQLKHQCDFYGNFIEPRASSALRARYNVNFRKRLDYFTELPLLFLNSEILVDVANTGFNAGFSPKFMGCWACGGFALSDYRRDFRSAVGDIADRVMYRDVDHLNTLIDYYQTHPSERRDISRCLQYLAQTKFSFSRLCARLLAEEPLWHSPN
jgi:hypothetical protein